MTLAEYELRMEAYELKEAAKQQDMALQAWYNTTVQSCDDNGKPVYKTFTQFFNVVDQINRIRSKYEANYQPIKTPVSEAQTQQQILVERIREFKRAHPKDTWRKDGK